MINNNLKNQWKSNQSSSFQSGINLKKQPIYQEVLLTNNIDKDIENEFTKYNQTARISKKTDSFFYHPIDKNIYLNYCSYGHGGAGHQKLLVLDYRSEKLKKLFHEIANLNLWNEIYSHTKFLIQMQDSSAWFSFQFLPKDKKFFSKSFAIISAQNPYMLNNKSLDNKILHDDFLASLIYSNYEYYETAAELCGHIEDCIIIYNIPKDESINIGKKLNQESIVFFENDEISIINCSNSKKNIFLNTKDFYKE